MTPAKRFRVSPITVLVIIAGAAAAGYGATYVFKSEPKAEMPPQPSVGPITPPKPPKVEFLGMAEVKGTTAEIPQARNKPVETLSDDAMVLWVKVTAEDGLSRDTMPRLAVVDSDNRMYTLSMDRPGEDGIFTLHLKKGYDKPVPTLTFRATGANGTLLEHKIGPIPPPVTVIPDTATADPSFGKVTVRPGRGGRKVATLELDRKPGDPGYVVVATAESHVALDSNRPNAQLLVSGSDPFSSRVALPNAAMNKFAKFDFCKFEPETTTETVVLHGAHLDLKFGQPTIVIDSDQTLTTDKGHNVVVPKQSNGPRRQPKHIHPQATLNLSFDPGATNPAVSMVQPTVVAQVDSPTPATFGLEALPVMVAVAFAPNSTAVFPAPAPTAGPKPTGGFKQGPLGDLKIRFTIVKPKVTGKQTVILPILQSQESAPAQGGTRG